MTMETSADAKADQEQHVRAYTERCLVNLWWLARVPLWAQTKGPEQKGDNGTDLMQVRDSDRFVRLGGNVSSPSVRVPTGDRYCLT